MHNISEIISVMTPVAVIAVIGVIFLIENIKKIFFNIISRRNKYSPLVKFESRRTSNKKFMKEINEIDN